MQAEDFSEIVLSKIDPDLPLPADIYLRVDKKFIKFKEKGDSIGAEKYELFISKGVKEIFLRADDIMLFLKWIDSSREEEVNEQVKATGEENRSFFEANQGIKEKVYDTFFEEELDEELVGKLNESVSEFVSDIKKQPITTEAIKLLATNNRTLAEHSVNVANLSVYLGMALGHGHQFVLENLYMGSLFHDYGKAKIPEEILNNQDRLYIQAIQDHPEKGVKMIKKTSGIPAQVLQIVMQHHEQFNGHGYPKGLAGDQIYELAQIVSMANIFVNALVENKNFSESEKYKKALKVIEYDGGKNWNPKIVPRALEALSLAFK